MTDPSQPPRMLKSPLVLKAMTLRGLGPYLHGARLEIKPLTILCGENGSGKSTWIEALRFLKLATDDERDDSFPLKVPHDLDCFSLHSGIVYKMGKLFYEASKEALLARIKEDEDEGEAIKEADDDRKWRYYDLENDLTLQFAKYANAERPPRLSLNEPLWLPGLGIGEPPLKRISKLRLARLKILGELNESGEVDERARKDNRKPYGPPGCIGLVLEVLDAEMFECFRMDGLELPCKLTPGTTIQLRCTLPGTNGSELEGIDGLHEWIEIILNGKHVLCLQRSVDQNDQPDAITCEEATVFAAMRKEGATVSAAGRKSRSESKKKERHLTFECTSDFLGREPSNEDERIKLGRIDRDGVVVDVEGEMTRETLQRASDAFLKLFRQIVREVTRGVFPVGPIRQILSAVKTVATPTNPGTAEGNAEDDGGAEQEQRESEERDRRKANDVIARLERRYVGHDGRHTQEQHANWAYNLMRQPTEPYCGQISSEFAESQFNRDLKSPAELFERLSDKSVTSDKSDTFQKYIFSLLEQDEPGVEEGWRQEHDAAGRDQRAIAIFNRVLEKRNLFRSEFRPDVTGEAELMIGSTAEEQNERLSSLSVGEVARVNRLLLEAKFDELADAKVREKLSQNQRVGVDEYPARNCWHRTGYLFETFVSFWVNWLCETRVQYGKFKGEPLDKSWSSNAESKVGSVPNGGLVNAERAPQKRGDYADQTGGRDDEEEDLRETISTSTTRFPTDWSIMSTGFHQLAPIVVQAGLLHQNEIMAVENPEAHLHPSLQIEVAEFLMHQANADKIMLIETHSDLIVRRLLRAIPQSELLKRQEGIRIYFTHLEDGPEGANWKHAEMDQLQINDMGQIANWPKGFMDDDLEEANRWLAAREHQRSLDDEE